MQNKEEKNSKENNLNQQQWWSSTWRSNLYTKRVASKVNPLQSIQPQCSIPTDPKVRALLARLVLQEAIETVHALGFHPENLDDRENFILSPTKEYEELDLFEIIDGACDTTYVSIGLLCAMGIPDLPHLDEVCRANNSKFPNGIVIINEFGKYQKPEGWQPPDHRKVMREYKDKIDLAKEYVDGNS